jgi:Transglycosylase-like domain
MKQAIGVVAAILLVLCGSLVFIPYAIGAALLTMSEIDNQHCGVVFNSTTFTAAQVTDADREGPLVPVPSTFPSENENAASATTPEQPMSQPVTLNRVLATIRQVESANNYRSDSAAGTASGAYQFTDATWNYFRGYLRAVHAPAAIQDERAAIAVAAVLQQNGLEAVPVSWYWPLALRSVMDGPDPSP